MPLKDQIKRKEYLRGWYQRRKEKKRHACKDCGTDVFFGEMCRSCCRTGENSPSWHGGIKKDLQGYRSVRDGGKYRKEHIIVLERIFGVEIKRPKMAHHWDENRENNDPKNLCLFRHHGAHTRLHHFARRHGIKIGLFYFEQPWLCER